MNKRNYQKELDAIIEKHSAAGEKPSLLLHVCCAPCASYVLEYLYAHFMITVAYYNPNITDEEEYLHRYSELRRYVAEREMTGVRFAEVEYKPADFYAIAKGHESDPEGGARCALCFSQRLGYAARLAKEGGYRYFATTLTISPLKNAELLNAVGEKLGREYGVEYLPSDFKKKNGYKRSIELCREYNLYRQNYCGCVFSQKEAQQREMMKKNNGTEETR